LLAEIAGHRRLGRLGLRLLAPTVLVSSAGAERTLAALREHGYSPVPVTDGGEITIRRTRVEEPHNGKLILLPGGQVAELSELAAIGGAEAIPHIIAEPIPDPHEHAARLISASR